MTIETDQDQTTQTTEQTSSDQSTENNDQQGSSSSTTENNQQTDQDRIDLAGDDADDQEDTRTDEEKAAEAARAELFGAPAEDAGYEIEGLPEGMEIDKEALEAVAPTFRELGLSNKGASKVAGVYAEKVLPAVTERVVKGIEGQVLAQRAAWEDEAREAIKSNGQSLKNKAGEVLSFDAKGEKQVLSIAAKALDQLAPAGFREWLKETGLSQNPQMVAFAYQAGRRLAEDRDFEETSAATDKKADPKRVRQAGGMDPNKFFNA